MGSSRLTLACVGDVLIANRTFEAYQRVGAAALAERIWEPLEGVDVVLANHEVPITDSVCGPEDKLIRFKTRPDILRLFDQRFVLSLANNHILDYGERGLFDTLEALDTRGIQHAGAGRNLDEARRPALIHAAGTTVGVICAGALRFRAATETSPGICPARGGLLKESIQDTRTHADVVAVSLHEGVEFMSIPSPEQLQLANLCLEEGARVVCFHHSHCISGLLRHRWGVAFFGTGDYVFPATTGGWSKLRRESALWSVTLEGGEYEVGDVKTHPVVLDREGLPTPASGGRARRILGRIERYSRLIEQSQHLGRWYMWERLMPQHVAVVAERYLYVARRRGVGHMVRELVRLVREQTG